MPRRWSPRKTLKERIPEISEVVAIDQEQEPLTESGIEEAASEYAPAALEPRGICIDILL